VYAPATRTLVWGRAGHAAPLLGRDGEASPLDLPPGLLLGADGAATYETRTITLAPDDLVLLYTDGLVERRGDAPLLPEVLSLLADASAAGPPDCLPHLVAGLQRPSPDDDTCTLAAHIF
jgi:serine phosphatase RsbU (regulator of sigma subunit)